MNLAEVLQVAVDTAIEAGGIIRTAFPRTVLPHVRYKGAVNPVTDTDTATESFIINRLLTAFPDHRILAEEGGFVNGNQTPAGATDAPMWVVDPLDGTNNFAHGFPHIAISLALQIEGQTVVGVIHDPLRGETFAAMRDGGCTLNGETVHASPTAHLADAFLGAGFPYDRRTAADNNTERLDHFLRRSQGVRRAGSAALDLAYVACGRLDGFFEIRLSSWDIAAGVLLVCEAGGQVTDFEGLPTGLNGETVLASNSLIHQEMLRVIREGASAPIPE
ncbi:MAG: inositol monophosphatase [Chloroflexi bacterium]|nr:inositol monophosphatase [Chloroflexota bacterium]